MKLFITSSRVRSVISGSVTEADAALALRSHKIPFRFSTDGGYLHIKVPARSGIIRIYKTASRSAPLAIVDDMRTCSGYSAPDNPLRPWPAFY